MYIHIGSRDNVISTVIILFATRLWLYSCSRKGYNIFLLPKAPKIALGPLHNPIQCVPGVRIPPGAWMSVSCECCVLSGRGLCDGLITCPEQSYQVWCVSKVCDHETST
jgi:hypothetical protein